MTLERALEATRLAALSRSLLSEASRYRGTSPIRKRPPPYDPPTTLGIGLR